MNENALLHTLAAAVEQAKPKYLVAYWVMWRPRQKPSDSLSDVEAHALADTVADTIPKAKS